MIQGGALVYHQKIIWFLFIIISRLGGINLKK